MLYLFVFVPLCQLMGKDTTFCFYQQERTKNGRMKECRNLEMIVLQNKTSE